MSETETNLTAISDSYMHQNATISETTPEKGIVKIIPAQLSVESQMNLQREGLTTLQQLNKSGNLLISSMEKVIDLSGKEILVEDEDGTQSTVTKDFDVKGVVECAKALAAVAQAQTNLVKTLKDFTK